MSRAFVSDKEVWEYCAKAGERCLHAEAGKDCHQTDCPHYSKVITTAPKAGPTGDRVVRREKAPAGSARQKASVTKPVQNSLGNKSAQNTSATKSGQASPSGSGSRPTKRAKIKPPRRWGGRSG